jgi:hypothetical protein
MNTCKKVLYNWGATCDFCYGSIGDSRGEVGKIYVTEKWYDPDKVFRLCEKDYEKYLRYLEEEKENYRAMEQEDGYEAFTDHHKRIYNNLVGAR